MPLPIIRLKSRNKELPLTLYHLSDIHIRKESHRVTEYITVFDNLYNIISKDPSPKVIVICGDILHQGSNITPNVIHQTKYFFKKLTDLCDVILIPGNHDINCNNPNERDALSTILQNFKSKNKIHYLTLRRLYTYKNIMFGHTPMNNTIVKKCKITTNKIKIALYHGMLYGSTLPNNQVSRNGFTTKDFSDYDIALFGDIHKFQYLNQQKTIAYSGSLIQQNHGESLNHHGLIKWDLTTKTSQFIPVPNKHGFITLDLNTLNTPSIPTPTLPLIPKIRLIYDDNTTSLQELQTAITKLKEQYPNSIITKSKKKQNIKFDIKVDDANINISDISKKDVVIKMITSFMEDSTSQQLQPAEKTIILAEINKELTHHNSTTNNSTTNNSTTNNTHTMKNIKLNNLSFDNLFPYSQNNSIDFTSFNGIIGLIADNASGKSSIIDAILLAIYGKYSRGTQYQAVNINESTASSTISLNINDINYKITRNISKDYNTPRKNRNQITYHKNNTLITKKNLSETEKQIRHDVCDYQYLINAGIILQNENNFIDMKPIDREKYIFSLLNLNVFGDLKKIFQSKYNTLAKSYKKLNTTIESPTYNNLPNTIIENKQQTITNNKSIQQIKDTITNLTTQLNNYKTIINIHNGSTLTNKIHKSNKQKLKTETTKLKTLQKQQQTVTKTIKTLNTQHQNDLKNNLYTNRNQITETHLKTQHQNAKQILQLTQQKELLLTNIYNISKTTNQNTGHLNNTIKEIEQNIKSNTDSISQLQLDITTLKSYIIPPPTKQHLITLTRRNDSYNILLQTQSTQKQKRASKLLEIKALFNKITKLKKYKYNKKCKYCVANPLTKDKLLYTKEYNNLLSEHKTIIANQTITNNEINTYMTYHTLFTKHLKQQEQNNTHQTNIKNKINTVKELTTSNEILKLKLEKHLTQKQINKERLSKYKSNKITHLKITQIKNQINSINSQPHHEDYITSQILIKTIEQNTNKITSLKLKLQNTQTQTSQLTTSINTLTKEITKYNKINSQFKDNNIFNEVQKLTKEIQTLHQTQQTHETKAIQLIRVEVTLSNDHLTYTNLINTRQTTSDKITIFKKIVKLLSNNGILNYVMTKMIIPRIQSVTNNILEMLTDFKISIDYNRYGMMIYKHHNNRMIESRLLSGYEKFATNLALKLALNKLNSNIRTNFLIIDEGFGSCDKKNLQKLDTIFDYIRQEFDWCLMITHLDEIKMVFDKKIKIHKENGRSNILN